MCAVFAKTTKGQNEITGKAGGLTPRVRRVLIFADGKRTGFDPNGMVVRVYEGDQQGKVVHVGVK